MKGEKRAAYAMLVADLENTEESCETLTMKVLSAREKISKGRGAWRDRVFGFGGKRQGTSRL
jgi:hypothetical protein